ncbi:MAG: hypothetical protein R3D98_03960 [Candidatus Krumholzibacteriia bacterium]
MASRGKRWLTGCGLGCGGTLVLGLIVLLVGSVVMTGPLRQAVAAREELEARHGDQASYTPPADGAIAPDRLARFLDVREAVMGTCESFAATGRQFARMDALDEDAPKREVLTEVGRLTREVFGMVPHLGAFFEARNQALLAADMGLGEYTYIYIMAYHRELRTTPTGDAVFGDPELNARVHAALQQMLRNQLAALPPDAPARTALMAELDLLRDAPQRLPWQDGLPAAVVASLAPQRQRLDDLFCAATVGLEFNTNRTRGLSVVSE